ncbi:ATP-dependent RNA helicase dbp7, partial [Linderina pennispora]
MADDDGFILNFATAETSAPVVRTTKAKNGGRWKDRLHERRVKKHQATKEQKKLRQSKAGSDPSQHQQHRQEQKTQQDDEVARLLDEISGHHPSKQKQKASSAAGSSGPTALAGQAGKQIVSSLFTKNPEIPVLPSNAGQDKSVSSNAVVDTSTFEGLGLDPDIVKFLHTKLEISKPTAIQQNALPTLIGKEVVGGCDEAFDVERDGQTEHDAFVQAATGSGKTLAYLLPIIHRLLTASTMPTKGAYPSRELGTFAIILTPTRELAQQVYETVQTLVNMPLDKSTGMRAHWMVPGIVVGGEKKQSEKGRLRKGVTILACTPGRLLDHLENTKAFMVDNLRWLVLDEADRLLELGFEETLSKILALLDEKLKLRVPVLGRATMVNSPLLPRRRINVLCSATLQDNVKRLATQSLSNPRFISATRVHENADQAAAEAQGHRGKQSASSAGDEDLLDSEGRIKFTVPDQLVQRAVIVPAKLRLVTLVAQIKNTFRRQPSSKLIVFLSCKDAVDFMYFLMAHGGRQAEADDDQDDVTRDL